MALCRVSAFVFCTAQVYLSCEQLKEYLYCCFMISSKMAKYTSDSGKKFLVLFALCSSFIYIQYYLGGQLSKLIEGRIIKWRFEPDTLTASVFSCIQNRGSFIFTDEEIELMQIEQNLQKFGQGVGLQEDKLRTLKNQLEHAKIINRLHRITL